LAATKKGAKKADKKGAKVKEEIKEYERPSPAL